MKRHKYGVAPKERRTADGIVFASRAEMRRYLDLKLLRDDGQVLQFFRQSPVFHLPGGVHYVPDFLVFWSDGRVTVEDVKGCATEAYKIKKRQAEALYPPFTITEIRK